MLSSKTWGQSIELLRQTYGRLTSSDGKQLRLLGKPSRPDCL